jgi:hypothetical protein
MAMLQRWMQLVISAIQLLAGDYSRCCCRRLRRMSTMALMMHCHRLRSASPSPDELDHPDAGAGIVDRRQACRL